MNFIDPRLQEYCEKHSSPEGDILHTIYRQTYLTQINPRMVSGHLEGKILQLLVALAKPKNILEIGTYTGYSAISMALAAASDCKIHSIEIDPELKPTIESNIKLAGVGQLVSLYIGNAAEIIPDILSKTKIDMVFMDADKSNYPLYFNLIKDHMPAGGLIIADNVLWSGKILDNEAIQKDLDTAAIDHYNKMVAEDSDFEKVILPVRDGISIARKI